MTHVALLRGVNVGGKNKLPMKDLAAMFAKAGCTNVRTLIQSGNVIFDAKPSLASSIAGTIESAIEAKFGFHSPVITRSAAELRSVAEDSPFPDVDVVHVAFLAAAPSADRATALDPKRSPGDSFAVRGREIYLHLPNGVGKSKITNAWLDAQLRTTSTIRNWRTLGKLVDALSADV